MKSAPFILLLFMAIAPTSLAVCNNDGVVDSGEQCDDGNTLSGDGCYNCTLDSVFLDFNTSNSEEHTMIEFFDIDQVVFFADQDSVNLTFTPPNMNLSRIILVMIGDASPVRDNLDLFITDAFQQERLKEDFGPYFTINPLLPPTDPRLNISTFINISLVTVAEEIRGSPNSGFFGGDGNDLISYEEALIVLLSAGYEAGVHPGFSPREFCMIFLPVDDTLPTTTSCLTLLFIGRNDDPPTVTYVMDGVVSFTEGQSEYVGIITGNLTVEDPDHPRYEQMSAYARIENYIPGSPEFLRLTLLPNFTSNYSEGVLRIEGEGTPEEYSHMLSTLQYLNNMTEPVGSSRRIIITVSDGIFTSDPESVQVNIINTNDDPLISLTGPSPIVTNSTVSYVEGSGQVEVVPRLVVVDTDPQAMIQRVEVRLNNAVDGAEEELGVSNSTFPGIYITSSNNTVIFTGAAPVADYTTAVRRITYSHNDAQPGNPTTDQPRELEFYVEDASGAGSLQNSTLLITIIPVNDPPILSLVSDESYRTSEPFLSGNTTAGFQYTEDDPALNFGRDIYLRDVDSNIALASLRLTGLLNNASDVVEVNQDLLTGYGINMTIVEIDGVSRNVYLTGEASPQAYEQILRSLTYRNLLTTNQVTDGTRVFYISVNDTEPLSSQTITLNVTVGDRNDAPVVDLGAGEGMDLNVTFVENGNSIPIVLPHLLDLMDEENHNISRITFELRATNGKLDPSDAIFLRSPLALQFINDFRSEPTATLLDFSLIATAVTYENLLLSIFYDNSEPEPTLYNGDGSVLDREILITIYDNNFLQSGQTNSTESNLDDNYGVSVSTIRVKIMIETVNDNRPLILIRAEPEGCGQSSTAGTELLEDLARRRRDVRAAASRMRKRSSITDTSKAPTVARISSSFIFECLDTIKISFSSNTSTPIVEVSARLDHILSFDTPEINSAHKFGVWLDGGTLVVVFSGCVRVEKGRAIYAMFEADRGDCDWTTPCHDDTICFQNRTGCPVSGSFRVQAQDDPLCGPGTGRECPDEEGGAAFDEGGTSQVNIGAYKSLVWILLVVASVTLFVACVLSCSRSKLRSSIKLSMKDSAAIPQSTLRKEKQPVEEIGSQDFVVMLTPSSPPPPYQAEQTSVAIETREKRQRKRGRRKAKSEMPPLQEEEEDEKLLSLSESKDDQGDAVITLSPETSHDMSHDQSPSSSADEEESEDIHQPSHSSREHLLLTSANNEGSCRGNPNRAQISPH